MAMSNRYTTGVLRLAAGALLLSLIAVGVVLRSTSGRSAELESPFGSEIERLRADAAQCFNYGDFTQAHALAQKLLDRRPHDVEAHLLMAEILLGDRRPEQAYEHARTAVDLNPNQEEAQFFAGVIASRIDRWEDAASHHRKAAELDPGSAKHLLHLAIALLRLDRADEAERQALRAQRLDGSAPEVYLLLAQIADGKSNLGAAMDQVDQALALLQPGHPVRLDYSLYKAQLLRRSGRPEQALNLLTALDPRDQQREKTIEELSQNYLLLDQPRKAAALWAELFAMQPGSARAAAEAGLCMVRAGQHREARRYLGYARVLDQRHPTVSALAEAISREAAAAPGG